MQNNQNKNKFDIVYFIICLGADSYSVSKKVSDQTMEWSALNQNFLIYVITDELGENIWEKLGERIEIKIDKKGLKKIFYRMAVLKKVSRLAQNTLYIRECFPIPFISIRKQCKWVIEIQGIQKKEVLLRSRIKYFVFIIIEKIWRRNFDAYISVSCEIASKTMITKQKKPVKVISNGINLNLYSTLENLNKTKFPNFFFMGNLDQPWQGYEQIVELAKFLPQSEFHIVGNASIKLRNYDNLYFHGLLQDRKSVV
jgi:hypothetical protein